MSPESRVPPNPQPHLPVLMVYLTPSEAQREQRRFHPKEFFCIGMNDSLIGRRFRAVFISDSALRHTYQRSRTEYERIQRWIEEVLRTRLAPGCQDQLHIF